MRKPRCNHSAAFKARVALEAIRREKSVVDIAITQCARINPSSTARRTRCISANCLP
jgi:transposase-like protein